MRTEIHRQIDIKKLIVAFRNFVKASKSVTLFIYNATSYTCTPVSTAASLVFLSEECMSFMFGLTETCYQQIVKLLDVNVQ